jgi:hypothetical protein
MDEERVELFRLTTPLTKIYFNKEPVKQTRVIYPSTLATKLILTPEAVYYSDSSFKALSITELNEFKKNCVEKTVPIFNKIIEGNFDL